MTDNSSSPRLVRAEPGRTLLVESGDEIIMKTVRFLLQKTFKSGEVDTLARSHDHGSMPKSEIADARTLSVTCLATDFAKVLSRN